MAPRMRRPAAVALRRVNSESINAAALACDCAEAVVRGLAPAGRCKGAEWVARNSHRTDCGLRSFKVHFIVGRWGGFATPDQGVELNAAPSRERLTRAIENGPPHLRPPWLAMRDHGCSVGRINPGRGILFSIVTDGEA